MTWLVLGVAHQSGALGDRERLVAYQLGPDRDLGCVDVLTDGFEVDWDGDLAPHGVVAAAALDDGSLSLLVDAPLGVEAFPGSDQAAAHPMRDAGVVELRFR